MPFSLFKKAVPRLFSDAVLPVEPPAVRPDRFLRVALTLIAVALWVNLLQPLARETAAWAQKGRAPKAAAARSSGNSVPAHTYAMVALDKDGNLVPGGDGYVTLSATNLQTALDGFPEKGWRVHSIIPSVSGGANFINTEYVLVLER